MTHGALHRVLTHEPISFRTDYALKVIGQKVFEIHTKHQFFASRRFFFFALSPPPASILGKSVSGLSFTHRNNFHSPEDLRQLNATTIDPRLHCSLRNLQEVDNFLITEFFNVSQYYARS